jgi:hypothetical protein
MPDRMQHLVSGHLVCEVSSGNPLIPPSLAGKPALLPVWWPGRFDEPDDHQGVEVLARYRSAGPDLYVADMPYASMPSDILSEWDALYGVKLRPSILDGKPCAVSGTLGRGSWLLSYSHLETPRDGNPGSEQASRWFLHLLRQACGADIALDSLPPLTPSALPILWEEPDLLSAALRLEALLELAQSLGLLFPRNSWLLGWRSGVPGSQFNSLRAALCTTLGFKPDDRRVRRWQARRDEFMNAFELFEQGARSWLLARRLSDTLADANPALLPREILVDQRKTLFGSPMFGGGLSEQLLDILEELV